MNRVLVIGCSAGGKSTVARRLGEALGVEVIHLDTVLWKPGCRLVRPQEEAGEIEDLLDRPRWVIDGNYTASLPMRLMRADTVVVVDFSRMVCLGRAMKRLWENWGRTRADMGANCPEALNLGFLKWIWEYPEKERPELMRMLREHGCHAEVVVLRNQGQVDRWLRKVEAGEMALHTQRH